MSKKAEIVLILGCPAAGKRTLQAEWVKQGYHPVEAPKSGESSPWFSRVQEILASGTSVVLNASWPKKEQRHRILDFARQQEVSIHGIFLETSIEEAQINLLQKMWTRYQRVAWTPEEIKLLRDPEIFPIAVLFQYRNALEIPDVAEGFTSITRRPFIRQWASTYTNKAILLDYDGTLRISKNARYKFPTLPEEVEILPSRKEILQAWRARGYLLLGVSNQSGVAKKQVLLDVCTACFDRTNELLEQSIDYLFCPHNVPPKCYCRKPQSGLGVLLIEKYQLNPKQCIFVGDQTTDKTFASRLGFQFKTPQDFFVGS